MAIQSTKSKLKQKDSEESLDLINIDLRHISFMKDKHQGVHTKKFQF